MTYQVNQKDGYMWIDSTGRARPDITVVEDTDPGFAGQRHKLIAMEITSEVKSKTFPRVRASNKMAPGGSTEVRQIEG